MFDSLLFQKYRPQKLEDLVLSSKNRTYFEELIKKGEIPHLLFCSSPGTGKTTLAKIIVRALDAQYRYINAANERGIDVVREKITNFAQTKSMNDKLKIIVMDEFHGFTPDAQRALSDVMEEYSDNVRFILTANHKNRIIAPIQSRCQIFELTPPLKGTMQRVVDIMGAEDIKVAEGHMGNLQKVVKGNYPDLRRIIGVISQNVIGGVFEYTERDTDVPLVDTVMKMILENKGAVEIRTLIIQNETEFSSDYFNLLKMMFEYIFKNVKDEQLKRESMLVVGRYMESHNTVFDFEINAYCCVLQLLAIFNPDLKAFGVTPQVRS